MPAYHPFRILAVAILIAMLVMTGIQTATVLPTRENRVERTQAKPNCKKKNLNKKCKKKGDKGGKEGGGGYTVYFAD